MLDLAMVKKSMIPRRKKSIKNQNTNDNGNELIKTFSAK